MAMDYGEMLKFSINGFKDGGTLRYAGLYFIVSTIFTVAIFALTGISGYDWKEEKAATGLDLLVYFALTVIMILAMIPLTLKIAGNGMKAAGIGVHKDLDAPYLSGKSAIILIRYVVQIILWALYTVFSLKNLKFLLLLAAAVAGFALMLMSAAGGSGLMALVGLAIFGLASAAYSFVVIYNFVRLVFVENIFLQNPHFSLRGMINNGWEGSQGKFWNIFAAYLVVSLVTAVAFIPFMVIVVLISFLSPLIADIFSGLFWAAVFVFFSYAMAHIYSDIIWAKRAPAPAGPGRKKAA